MLHSSFPSLLPLPFTLYPLPFYPSTSFTTRYTNCPLNCSPWFGYATITFSLPETLAGPDNNSLSSQPIVAFSFALPHPPFCSLCQSHSSFTVIVRNHLSAHYETINQGCWLAHAACGIMQQLELPAECTRTHTHTHRWPELPHEVTLHQLYAWLWSKVQTDKRREHMHKDEIDSWQCKSL